VLLFSPGVFRSVFFLFFLGWVILGPKKDEFYIGIALPRSPSHTLSLSLPFRSLRARSRKLIFTFGDCQKDGNRKIIIKRTAQEFSLVPLFAASVYFTDITLFCTFSPFIFCVFAGKRVYVDFFFSVLGKQEIPTAFFPLFFVFLTYAFFLPTCAFFSFAERLTHTGRLPHTDAHAHTQTHTHRPNNKNSFAVFDFCFFSFLALISAAAEANRFLFLLFVFFYLFLHFTSIGFSYRLIR